VSLVLSLENMFRDTTEFNANITHWNTSSVTNMDATFFSAQSFNQPLQWDVSRVTIMMWMFLGTQSFDQDVSAWDVRSVTDMGSMFSDATSFKADISGWNTSVVNSVNSANMFNGATAWLATYERDTYSPANDGPPSVWTKKAQELSPPPPSTSNTTNVISPPPPKSLVLNDYESSASRYSVVTALVVSIIIQVQSISGTRE
jgi:surface protein